MVDEIVSYHSRSFLHLTIYTQWSEWLQYDSLFTIGLGCSFHTPNCDTWPYSCSTGVIGCSYDYQARVHQLHNNAACILYIICSHFVVLLLFVMVATTSSPTAIDIVIHQEVYSYGVTLLVDKYCSYDFHCFVVPMTNSCFPLIRSNGDLDGRCYARQCYRYPDAQEPFYTVTRFG